MKKITKVNKQAHKYVAVALDLKTARKLKRLNPNKSYNKIIKALINGQ